MNALHVLAAAATALGLVGALALLVQSRNLYRVGTACEISLLFFAVSAAGYAVWLAYGLALGDVPLILVDVTGLVGATTALAVAVRLRRRRPCPTGIGPPQPQ
jgi:MtN3 and saliva related transmembrane protein